MICSTLFRNAALLLAATSGVLAVPTTPLIKHVGTLGDLYTGAVATKDLIFVSGTVPSINGSIPEGIEAQTATAIKNMAAILEAAGTSWDNVVKTTVALVDLDRDYAGMNKMYGQLVPSPKPARTTIQAVKLPGPYLIEMDAIAAIPRC